MNRNTLHAVSRLADGAEDLRVSMALVVKSLQVVDAVGHLAEDQAIGTATQLDSLPDDMVSTLGHHTAVSLNETPAIDLGASINFRHRSVLVAPLVSQNQLSGAVIITTARPLPPARRNIESLGLDRVPRARECDPHREPPASQERAPVPRAGRELIGHRARRSPTTSASRS